MAEFDLRQILPSPEATIGAQWPGGTIILNPRNPHAVDVCSKSTASLAPAASLARWRPGSLHWRVLLRLRDWRKPSECLSRSWLKLLA